MSWSGYFACGPALAIESCHRRSCEGMTASSGLRLLITEPLSTDRIAVSEWGGRPTSQGADQELFQLTCNYFASGWHAAKHGHVGQSWSKTNDWLWFGDEILNPSATESALKFIWIGCENVGRVGLKCQWWPNRWFAGLCFSALLYLPHEQRHYTTVVTLSSVHLKRMHQGRRPLENYQVSRHWRRCESTKKVFHISGAASGLRQGLGRSNGRSARS